MIINLPNKISEIVNNYPELKEKIKNICLEYTYETDTPLNRTIISEKINERVKNLVNPIRRNSIINDILDISYKSDKQTILHINIENLGI